MPRGRLPPTFFAAAGSGGADGSGPAVGQNKRGMLSANERRWVVWFVERARWRGQDGFARGVRVRRLRRNSLGQAPLRVEAPIAPTTTETGVAKLPTVLLP